jgi:hypothetical protein
MGAIDVKSMPGVENAFFNYAHNRVSTGMMDPDVIAHELGHAENTQNSPIYQKFLTAVRGLQALNKTIMLPAMLGMHAFMGDDKRRDIVATLAGVSSALAAPIVHEEMSASANAVGNSDDKLRTLKRLLPGLGAHVVSNAIPVGAYSLDQRF